MTLQKINRRTLLKYGLWLGVSGLTGCGRNVPQAYLASTKDTLPKEWLKILPSPWRFQLLSNKAGNKPYRPADLLGNDLVAFGDGWLSTISPEIITSINVEQFLQFFDEKALEFLNTMPLEFQGSVLPLAVSPWAMLFRNGNSWIADAREGWDVLLDPNLKGHLVLPESPRLIMSIAQTIARDDALRRLRRQVLTFDDRNGLNWLLSGDARVVVLPLQSCFRALSRDPRLSLAVPKKGAPLNWTLLVRPVGSNESLSLDWIKKTFSSPLLPKLLAGGWIPSIKQSELRTHLSQVPQEYKSTVVLPKETWEKCWSLTPLTVSSRKQLEYKWNNSTP